MAFGFSKFWTGIKIKAKSVLTGDSLGDIEVSSGTNKASFHNGTTASPLVTEAHTATLTNKTIDAASNTISNISNAEVKSGAAIDAAKIGGGAVSNTEFSYLDGVTSAIQAQIDGKQASGAYISALTGDVAATGPGSVAATIQPNAITNSKVAAAAAIARSKLAAGTANRLVVNDVSGVQTDASAITANRALVSDSNGIPTQSSTSDTEIGYVAGVTSAIQTQINNKQPLDATLTSLAAFNSNGLVTQTAADTFTSRTITGTANTITVLNGSGVAGNPTITIVDNPVIPGTADIQIPAGTTAQRPGSPAAGMLRLNSDTNQFEGYTNAWGAIAGSGGSINYISPNDGSSSTGYATYADAAQAAPVDGTGGSPASTFATSTDSSLVSTTNYLWTKSANNRQGEGWSFDFSIDQAYQAKPLTLSFLYKIASGTFADGDMTCWIYDRTNSVLIQPSAYSILNVSGSALQKCEFQASSNSTSYRLIVHTASASALAYTVRFDQISVSPGTTNAGAVVTDWVLDTNIVPTNFGTTVNQIYSRRVGAELQVRGTFTTGTAVASNASITLTGRAIDSTKMSAASTGTQVGMAERTDASSGGVFTNANAASIFYDGSDTTKVYFATQLSSSGFVKITASTFDSGGSLSIYFAIPIAGWGVTQILSNETDTRIVSAEYNMSSGVSTTSSNPFNYDTRVVDTHSAVTTGVGTWKFTAPVPGTYMVSSGAYWGATNTQQRLFKNGVYNSDIGGGSSTITAAGAKLINLLAGDYIDIRPAATVTPAAGSTNVAGSNYITIYRLSGPAQVAASEKVYLQYTGNAGTVLSANVTNIDFTTKVVDSHGAWNGTTFTAPRPGWYNITGSVLATVAGARDLIIYVNGSSKIALAATPTTANVLPMAGGIYLLGGDALTIRTDTGFTLSNSSSFHNIAITSQG